MRRLILIATFLVAGCATKIQHQVPMPANLHTSAMISNVSVSPGTIVGTEIADRLKSAVEVEARERAGGDVPLVLVVTVADFKLVGGGARFWAGALAGSNRMAVNVVVHDSHGDEVAEYTVVRTANPGGYGAFFDQQQALLDKTAEGIVAGLLGQRE